MHTFGIIEEFARFETVTFYTLRREDAVLSETDDFLKRIEKEERYRDQLDQLLAWLEYVGNRREGAFFDLFRPERNCVALPPKRKYLNENIDLRVYCHWVSECVIILYNGGVKTAQTAQDCPNVSRHFYNAQSWTRQLLQIGIETDGQEITNIDELYLKY